MRACMPCAVLLIALSLAGCVGGPFPLAGAGGPVAIPTAAFVPVDPMDSEVAYTLDSGDKLRVTVFGQDGITNTYIVDAGGNLILPLVGSVRARGLTARALSAAIAERLRAGFIREPHVAVEVETYRPFFILGEVTAPGQYPFVPHMTAETAVAIAGGFTPRALHGPVQITRTLDGEPVRSAVPLTMPVRPGDTIMVKERWF